jgi:STAS domain-containing protein
MQGAGGSVDLSLSTRTVGDRTIVEVGGEIDVYTAPKLREQLVELVNDGNYHLVVDMEGVDFPYHRSDQGVPDPHLGRRGCRGDRLTYPD